MVNREGKGLNACAGMPISLSSESTAASAGRERWRRPGRVHDPRGPSDYDHPAAGTVVVVGYGTDIVVVPVEVVGVASVDSAVLGGGADGSNSGVDVGAEAGGGTRLVGAGAGDADGMAEVFRVVGVERVVGRSGRCDGWVDWREMCTTARPIRASAASTATPAPTVTARRSYHRRSAWDTAPCASGSARTACCLVTSSKRRRAPTTPPAEAGQPSLSRTRR